MRIWQNIMISLARSAGIKDFIQSRKSISDLAIKFVGGRNVDEAIGKTKMLKAQNINTSSYFLGEYVDDQSKIEQTVLSLKEIIKRLAESNFDIHVSVDPTQIGYLINQKDCTDNIFELACIVKDRATLANKVTKNFLMLDMEDSSNVDFTLQLYNKLRSESIPAAVTLQVYLYRSQNDLEKLINTGGAVRLVKGAFTESKKIAFSSRKLIDENYLKLAKIMLSDKARALNFYPIFGTHDDKLIDKIIETAKSNGWKKENYEFELLYGVRTDLQNELIKNGESLRLYLPFGVDWWPYAIRRIGESSKNARFLMRLLFK
jgi:proline dehydrogenase